MGPSEIKPRPQSRAPERKSDRVQLPRLGDRPEPAIIPGQQFGYRQVLDPCIAIRRRKPYREAMVVTKFREGRFGITSNLQNITKTLKRERQEKFEKEEGQRD